MVGTLQERYGWDKERAEREADSFFSKHSH
jgi:uncharacterized protein YjbJ (UPF0337 family)